MEAPRSDDGSAADRAGRDGRGSSPAPDRRATVRFRAVLSVAVLLAAALGVLGVVSVHAVRASLTEQLDEQLQAARTIPSPSAPTGPLPAAGVEGGTTDPQVLELVFGSDGRLRRFVQQPDVLPVLPVMPSNEAAALSDQIYTAPAEDGHSTYRVLITPAADGGARVLAISSSEVDRTVHALERAVILTGAVAFLLGFALVWWVLRRGLRPLAHLADEAERVVGDDDGGRVGGRDDRSEVARVSTALDRSLDRLDAARAGAEQARSSAADADRRLGEFIAGAAIELRGPTEALARESADLRSRMDSGAAEAADALRASAREIESSVAELAASLDELHWLTEPSRRAGIAPQAVDLAVLVPEVIHDVALDHPDRRMAVDVQNDGDHGATILGDDASLRYALTRVVTRACEQVTSALAVEVTLRGGDETVAVIVVDHAHDLDPEDADGLLRPFHRSRSAERSTTASPGGLFVPAAIVHDHGGEVVLSTTPGGGVTIIITLPTLSATAARQRAAHDEG